MKSYVLAFVATLAMAGVASASSGSGCVNITTNNALNIGSCLGSTLDYCSGTGGTTGLTQGVTKLLSCLLTGLYTYGSPQGIVNALGPLLVIIVNRLAIPSISLPVLGNLQLCPSSPCLNFFMKNDTCQGPITVSLPGAGNLTSCVGDLATLCTAGSPTTTSDVNSLIRTIACILGQIPVTQLMTVLRNVGCQLINLLNTLVQSASLSTEIKTALGAISLGLKTVLMLPTCPTTSG